MVLALSLLRFTTLEFTDGGNPLKLHAKRGRNQQGLCFVSTDALDPSAAACELRCDSNSIYSDLRGSMKVPEGIVILDSRIYDMLHCSDEDEVTITLLSDKIPICTEINLDIISQRDLHTHTVAQAISKRIDDFQEHFEGLILQKGQEFTISDLGITFVVRSLSPTDPVTNGARIIWKNLLKIHLGALESHATNLCIIAEISAATQISDVQIWGDVNVDTTVSRHKAILQALETIENKFNAYGNEAQFAGFVFSDEVLPFITYDSQTGEESETTALHSSSLIEAFRKWFDTSLEDFSNRPSNPGAALKHGIEQAQSLNESNSLSTTIVFFSSGIYSAGQNPVKVTRMNLGDRPIRILCISVGQDSATDIMEAISKEGKGKSIHMTSEDRMDSIVDAINDLMISTG